MAAGAVSAPFIFPMMHQQTHRNKNHIDTHTPVFVHSDSPGVFVFFSLDGSKPTAAGGRKYSGPIRLPAGRVTVRAVAVSRDGRQSSTVTKVFSVDPVDTRMEDIVQQGTSSPAESSNGSVRTEGVEPRMVGNCPLQSGPRFLNSRLGSRTAAVNGDSSRRSEQISGELSHTLASRVQRETDYLRCARCLSPWPSDPFARFCSQCGATVSPLANQRRRRLPPAERGQTRLCVFCGAVLPINTHTCLICEEPVEPQLMPQATLMLQDHVLCVCCGSGNPPETSTCLTCESHLNQVGGARSTIPPVSAADGQTFPCWRCKRLNCCDARFCDWCGSKVTSQPSRTITSLMCQQCGASGPPYALYCTVCGVHLEAPPMTPHSDITQHEEGVTSTQVMPSSHMEPRVTVAPPTVDRSTQTTGLYYPSATKLQRNEQQRALQLTKQWETRDHHPPLTAISPGRGYWRKQLDHVCAHLRSYTQNNAAFRVLLGEPRLGRVVSAVLQEDQYEVSLTISFMAACHDPRQVDSNEDVIGSAVQTETLSRVTEGLAGGIRSGLSSALKTPKPAVRDSQLLEELGPGRGRVSAIQELLDQGADPSCCDGDGRHALAVAVVNGHHDIIPVLVQRGADVDQQSGQMKNTALHEAATLGLGGLRSAEVLLSCKASIRRRNVIGQTPYDVAVKSGCDRMAAQTRLDLMGKLGRTKTNLDVF
ncbi:double zinc ribbon and ankyrin repeat-containing protein 1 [Pholidichthys leucotaenia]